MIRILSLLLIISPLLAGCYSDKPIMTFGTGGTRYVIHDLKGNERGNILLKSTNKGLQGDLVYRGYEKEVTKYLLQNGFKTTSVESDILTAPFGFTSATMNLSSPNPKPKFGVIASSIKFERPLSSSKFSLNWGNLLLAPPKEIILLLK